MKRNILAFSLIAFLSACSEEKPAVYVSNSLMGTGTPSFVTATLSLEKFNGDLPADAAGVGTLKVERRNEAPPGWTGTQAIQWKVVTQNDMILITVPGAKDSFMLDSSPVNNVAVSFSSSSKLFQLWCKACEESRQGGLGWLPGQFNRVKD